MSGLTKIKAPQNMLAQVKSGGGTVGMKLTWSQSFVSKMNGAGENAQKWLDNEILRGCSPLVPFRTGMLHKSGTLGTVVGSGVIRWNVPYAKAQYYRKSTGSNGEARRGGYWFERWKNANGKATVLKVREMVGRRQ